MEAVYLEDPRVERMVRLAVKRKKRMFAEYHDIDEDSLVADMMGEVARAKYDPTQSQAHTFAYRVAWSRQIDVSRKRTRESNNQKHAIGLGEFKPGSVEDTMPLEELAETIYANVKNGFAYTTVPLRPKHCGKSYLDRAQRMTLHLLQQSKGWSCREAQEALKAHPEVLAAIGVTQTPSQMFFSRATEAVTQLQKIFHAQSALRPAI
jgi:DNA-directed RNA polymerase specialized sigma24 family protein